MRSVRSGRRPLAPAEEESCDEDNGPGPMDARKAEVEGAPSKRPAWRARSDLSASVRAVCGEARGKGRGRGRGRGWGWDDPEGAKDGLDGEEEGEESRASSESDPDDTLPR